MEKEKYKTINNFKNIVDDTYEISNYGNIRKINSDKPVKIKIANKKKHPYYAAYLKNKNNKKEWVLIHQLVAFSFIKKPKKYKNISIYDLVPDHIDNNGLNNYYKNLELKTRSENVSKAHKCGEINNKGENNKNAIITNNEAEIICKLLSEDKSYDEIIDIMNFPDDKKYRKLLIRIKNGIAWTDISKKYNIKNNIKYKKENLDTIEKIPLILTLISEGKSNSEICKEVWPDTDKRESKMVILRKIRKKEIYKEYLSSTTIESINK